MNLIEALKSGKPFRRSNRNGYLSVGSLQSFLYNVAEEVFYDYVTADDWVIKQEPREWTVMVSPDGGLISVAADQKHAFNWSKIRVREILEDDEPKGGDILFKESRNHDYSCGNLIFKTALGKEEK